MRCDFRYFLRKAFPAIRGGAPLSWNWHLDAIAYELERIACGHNRNLILTMPPRNLKSITISVAWVAWMLGRDPGSNFVCVSYSNELAAKMARDCLALMQTNWYRELFPGTMISSRRSAVHDFETTVGGGRLATSISGTLTGRGGSIIIIDDPIKPEEAHSEVTRNSVNQWFRSTLTSRHDDKETGATILVMQRLHEYDPAGMLLETSEWFELSLPAIAPEDIIIPLPRGRSHKRAEGDVLHPEREPKIVLERLRAMMGSLDFSAQYLQQPVPADGNIIKREWLKSYGADFEAGRKPGQIVQSWDTASKGGTSNDYSVCITAHVHRGIISVLDVFRAKLTFPELKAAAVRLALQFRANSILIEDAASGMQLLQVLRAEAVRNVPFPIAIRTDSDKRSRMEGASSRIEAGNLLLPEEAPWLAAFSAEILAFPNSRYDDQADALSQLINWALRFVPDAPHELEGPIVVDHRRALGLPIDMQDYIDAWGA